jgi:hypothetical protein
VSRPLAIIPLFCPIGQSFIVIFDVDGTYFCATRYPTAKQ